MKKTFAQSIICAILALSASPLTFAEVYNYVGKETYYSLDDPNSWSPKGGSGGSYEWLKGHTFIFDSNTNTDAANEVAVKYLKDGDTPDIEEIIFKTTTNVQASTSSNTTPYTSIKVGKVTVYTGTQDKLSTFSKITLGELSIGADSETPVSTSTIFSTSFNNNGNDYFYNSATDNSISADIGRVTLNGAVPTNPNDQNTTLWYINNQASASANYKSGVILVNGIDGTGTVRNNFGDNVEGSTTLVFTNTSDASFKGVLMDDWGSDLKLAKITVIMDGAENATQTIRQVSTSPSGVWNRNDLDSVGTIIKNGTLAVSTAGDVELSRVKLEGGALTVATMDDAGVGGTLSVRGIDWEGGEIKLIINHTKLESATGINQIGGEDAKYVFEVDLSDFASDMTFQGDEYTLLLSGVEAFGDVSKYEADLIYNGAELSGIDYEILSTAYGLNIALYGTIPEPSEVALFIGAAALFLAAYKRRLRK
ncbi:MAG TPA: hypothetical protein IAD27_00720 [Candidatus Merdousia gallistercoris]|nr:hypothetical protein [Candidatus Merdousia gallistercoris]